MAKLITTSGEITEVKPASGMRFSFEELQRYIGYMEDKVTYKMVEIIALPSGKYMVGNEEAKLINAPVNKEATKIWFDEFPPDKYKYDPNNPDSMINGDVLIVNENELER